MARRTRATGSETCERGEEVASSRSSFAGRVQMNAAFFVRRPGRSGFRTMRRRERSFKRSGFEVMPQLSPAFIACLGAFFCLRCMYVVWHTHDMPTRERFDVALQRQFLAELA